MILTPKQLANTSEASHQMAAMAFFAVAQLHGFKIAWDWSDKGIALPPKPDTLLIPELEWLHHTPNGGSRGDTIVSRQKAGGEMKAQGVKSGIPDFFWPLRRGEYPGLYIELKKPDLFRPNKPNNGCSEAQLRFGKHAHKQGYGWMTCYTWIEVCRNYHAYFGV